MLPDEIFPWTFRVPVSGAPGVRRVKYQMYRLGEVIGGEMMGYIIILLEQIADMREKIEQQIEDWKVQGTQAVDDFVQKIQEQIQTSLERQAEKAIDDLLLQCQGQASVMVIAEAFFAYCG